MGEMISKLPPWARRVLVIVAIVGPVTGAIANGIKTYYEVKEAKRNAHDASEKTEAGYETLAPAIEELQETLDLAEEWAEETSDRIEGFTSDSEDTERRLMRLEAYIEILASQRRNPRLPELQYPDGPKHWPDDPIAAVKNWPNAFVLAEDATKEKVAKKHARPIPKNIHQAQDYQEQRTIKACSKDDPLCGALE